MLKNLAIRSSLVCVMISSACASAWADPGATRLRRPAALQLSASERSLYVANRQSGSLCVVDLKRQEVAQELDLGASLSDLAACGEGRLLATDETQHELLLLQAEDEEVAVEHRVPVSQYPVSVAVGPRGDLCSVASLWSRRLTFVRLPDGAESPEVETTLDLPFAPRCQLFVRDGAQLIVADSFSGRLAVIDVDSQQLSHVREFPAHNIRGLGLSGDGQMLLVAHQMLNELAHTVRNDVHWGLLMSNDLRWLRLDAVLSSEADLYHKAHMHPLGHAGSATSDPAGLVVTENGTVAVSLGGVGELALGEESDFSLHRLSVGRRPTAVVASRDGKTLYVANTFDESVSIVDVEDREKVADIELGPSPELTLAERGELLFYDGRLSHDSWMSCNSCHTDGHTNSLLNDNLSDSSFGAPKRVFSLLGRSDTAPFAWDGSAETIGDQIRKSIKVTMQSDRDPRDGDVAALTAYLETLSPPPSIDVARDRVDDAAIDRGRELFASRQCTDCHAPPEYTTPATYDVGLEDKLGNTHFNPPSLRGLGQRAPYFHDGRAESLAAVFREHEHQLQSELTEEQLNDLLAFLRSL